MLSLEVRTNITKLTYDFKEGEKGKYVDFVSLYPTVNYSKRYPVGQPTKILEPDAYDNNWFGFMKCKVLPPKGLYHPVLPVKTKCGNAEKLCCFHCVELVLRISNRNVITQTVKEAL